MVIIFRYLFYVNDTSTILQQACAEFTEVLSMTAQCDNLRSIHPTLPQSGSDHYAWHQII